MVRKTPTRNKACCDAFSGNDRCRKKLFSLFLVFDVVADYAERKTIIQLSLFLAQSNSGVVADYAEQSFIIAF